MTGCMYLFHDFMIFTTFVSPRGAPFVITFPMISTFISNDFVYQKIEIQTESCRGHLGHISGKGGTGRHLGGIWEASGMPLETSGRMEAEEASGGQISNYVPHSATECKSAIKISISRGGFDGTINCDYIFAVRYERRLFTGSRRYVKAPLPTP